MGNVTVTFFRVISRWVVGGGGEVILKGYKIYKTKEILSS
jgi:hypothetical protein